MTLSIDVIEFKPKHLGFRSYVSSWIVTFLDDFDVAQENAGRVSSSKFELLFILPVVTFGDVKSKGIQVFLNVQM
jgi:hypothetical protein